MQNGNRTHENIETLTWQGSVIQNRFQLVYEFKWHLETRQRANTRGRILRQCRKRLHFIEFKISKVYLTDIAKLWRRSVEEWLTWTFRRDKITVAFKKRFGIRLLYRLSTGYLIVLFIINNWSLRWCVSASATEASLVQTKTYGERLEMKISYPGSSSVTRKGVTFYSYGF